jgi:lipoate-protein ligase A
VPGAPSPLDAASEQQWNEAALSGAFTGPAWRLWRYAEGAIVLGRAQRVSLEAVRRAAPFPVLLRASGGGAVLVGPWLLGLSLWLPEGHPWLHGPLVEAYRPLGEGLAAVLRAAGAGGAVAVSPPLRLEQDRGFQTVRGVCFGGLSPWEVAVGERKIAGLAQARRRNGALLVAGVLLGEPPWPLLAAALGLSGEAAALLSRITTSAAAEGARPERVVEGVAAWLAAAFGPAESGLTQAASTGREE